MGYFEAKCPNCSNRAIVDEPMTKVTCRACGYTSSYEDYLELMKSRAVQMAENLQLKLDKD